MNSISIVDISVRKADIRADVEKAPVLDFCHAWHVGKESVWWYIVLFEFCNWGLKC